MKGGDRVDDEALDAGDAVAREQHAVVAAEQAALVHGGDVDPVALGLEAIVDVRREHAHVVARILARERMHAIGAELDLLCRACHRLAQRVLERGEATFDLRRVAHLDVVARQAGVAAHRPVVDDRQLGVVDQRIEDVARQGIGLAVGGGLVRAAGIERAWRPRRVD